MIVGEAVICIRRNACWLLRLTSCGTLPFPFDGAEISNSECHGVRKPMISLASSCSTEYQACRAGVGVLVIYTHWK